MHPHHEGDFVLNESTRELISLPDGRTLSYIQMGDPDGIPVLFTIGSPSSAVGALGYAGAAERHGLNLIAIDKPGYGSSSRDPQRSLLRYGADVRDLADALGFTRVAVAGQSGGGPHALAAAYVLGDRVSTLSLISSYGPVNEPWAAEGHSGLMRTTTWFANHASGLMWLPVAPLKVMMGDSDRARRLALRMAKKLPPPERAVLEAPEAELILRGASDAFVNGMSAACDEFRALGRPWGFRVEDVHAPTDVWHGNRDTSCPITMARGIAERLPNGTLHELDTIGHAFFGPELDEAMAALRTRAAEAKLD